MALILLAIMGALLLSRPRYKDIKISRRRPSSRNKASLISKLSGVTVAAVEQRVGPTAKEAFLAATRWAGPLGNPGF